MLPQSRIRGIPASRLKPTVCQISVWRSVSLQLGFKPFGKGLASHEEVHANVWRYGANVNPEIQQLREEPGRSEDPTARFPCEVRD